MNSNQNDDDNFVDNNSSSSSSSSTLTLHTVNGARNSDDASTYVDAVAEEDNESMVNDSVIDDNVGIDIEGINNVGNDNGVDNDVNNNNINNDNISTNNDNNTVEENNVEEGVYNNNVTIQMLRDNIVSPNTNKIYIGDILNLLEWAATNAATWLTEYGNTQLTELLIRRERESIRVYRSRKFITMKTLLQHAFLHPLIIQNNITPERYMEYITSLRGRRTAFLSKSSYGNNRSSLYHLFRIHNGSGYSDLFNTELSNLFRGFFREITQRPNVNDNNNVGDPISLKEGKELLSIELYKKACEWLLAYGTSDGIFAYCYLVLCWNLACRAGNTARVTFRDITWTNSFDAFQISFTHMKNDQLGEEAKYPRHLYSNPLNPLVCPLNALSLYLTCCINDGQINFESKLFPGAQQDIRFSSIMGKVLEENWAVVARMGYKRGDLGTHSIRKGAVSYLASLPGGTPAASICIRAGWTMGKVRDIYMRYVTSGDEFVGRCLSLLSVLRTDFAISPPHFLTNEYDWLDRLRRLQFPTVGLIAGFEKLTIMGLASLLYHSEWLQRLLQPNHVYIQVSHIHNTAEDLEKKQFVHTTFPWIDINNHYSGIHPHVSMINELSVIKATQSELVGNFIEKMREVLTDFGVNGGRMTEENLLQILNNFQENFIRQVGIVAPAFHEPEIGVIHNEAERVYNVHYYLEGYKRVPQDWRFPRCGILDLWRQWWIGNSVRNIPPLRKLKISDVRHLDNLPLDINEMHGRTGLHREQRRNSRKILSDMKFLMDYISRKVTERNAQEAIINNRKDIM